MDKLYDQSETGCCPRFNPEPWDSKEVTFEDKIFIKEHLRTFMHIPLGFSKVMVRDMEMVKNADALPPEPLMLYEDTSMWGADLYIAVSKEVPGARMEKISGTFLTKVFEGTFKDAGKWLKETNDYVKSKGKQAKKVYFFYTTCPSCAKAYGKNYTVTLAKV